MIERLFVKRFVFVIMLAVGFVTFANIQAWAGETSSTAKNSCPESKLGIDYLALTQGNRAFSCMLANGEVEFLANPTAIDDYEEDLHGYWKEEFIPEVASGGGISRRTENNMKEYTPNMLWAFKGLPKEGKYSLLQSLGALYRSERGLNIANKLAGQ